MQSSKTHGSQHTLAIELHIKSTLSGGAKMSLTALYESSLARLQRRMKCTIFQKHSHALQQSLSAFGSLQFGPEYIRISQVSIGCDPEMPSHLFAQFLLALNSLLFVCSNGDGLVFLCISASAHAFQCRRHASIPVCPQPSPQSAGLYR